jgi:hypothetical protein
LVDRPPEKVLWRDLLILESMLARLQSKETLAFELTMLRGEYKELIGADAYDSLKLPVVPLPPSDADYSKALAEYETLLQELHWNYLSAPARERERTKLLGWISLSLAFLLVFLTTWVWWYLNEEVLALVAGMGALGGWLSAFRRAQSPALHSMVLLNLRRAPWSAFSFAIAPWVGGLSAILLAFLFSAGVMNGRLFPNVRWTDRLDPITTNSLRGGVYMATNLPPSAIAGSNAQTRANDRIASTNASGARTNTADTNPPSIQASSRAGGQASAQLESGNRPPPSTGGGPSSSDSANPIEGQFGASGRTDPALNNPPPATLAPMQWHADRQPNRWWFGGDTEFALLLVWAFIAGFSERLVPDLLNRIAKKTEGAV